MSKLSKPPVCDSVFDVAFWTLDRALNDGEYLQPQKMQKLLYLAQAYYGAASKGQKLMPCVFVATALGPVEPMSWRVFENGRPNVSPAPIPERHTHFLESLWRRFGAHATDYLARLVTGHPPYREAEALGKRAEISFDSMIAYYGRKRTAADEHDLRAAPALDTVIRPRVMRSHKGRAVNVRPWAPRRLNDQ